MVRRRPRKVALARRPGAEEVLGRRPPLRGDGRCASPGCGEEALEGGRFCVAHQALLDRVRAELEADAGDRGAGRAPRRRPIGPSRS